MNKENFGSKKMYPVKNLFLGTYFGSMYNNSVSVPAAVTNSTFLLDFKQTLKESVEGADAMSDQKRARFLSLIVAVHDRLNEDEIVTALMADGLRISVSDPRDVASGVTEADLVRRFVANVRTRVSSALTESGMVSLTASDILRAEQSNLSLTDFAATNLSTVSSVVGAAQSFWASFMTLEKGDVLATELNTLVAGNALLSAASSLYKVLKSGSGGYVAARESFVVDHIFSEVFKEPFVSKQTSIEGKFYVVDDVNIPDLKYSEALAAYMWCVHRSMGVSSSLSADDQINIADVIKETVSGVGVIMPFIPADVGHVDTNRVEKSFQRVFLLHLIRRLTTDNAGDYQNRVSTAIKANRFFKLEEYEKGFNEHLYVLSACYEAFRDSAFFYADLFKREDVLFLDWETLHHVKQKQITEFVTERLKTLETATLSLTHPAWYRLPSHVIANPQPVFPLTPLDFEFALTRSQRDKLPSFVISDPENDVMLKLAQTKTIAGSWWDIVDKLTTYRPRMLNNAPVVQPLYHFEVGISNSLMMTDVLKASLSYFPMSEFAKMQSKFGDLANFILSKGQLEYFNTPEEMSMSLQLPLEMALVVWNRGNSDKTFVNLAEVNQLTFFLRDDQLVPVEFVLRDQPNRYVTPFAIKFPGIVSELSQSYYNGGVIAVDFGSGTTGPVQIDKSKPVLAEEAVEPLDTEFVPDSIDDVDPPDGGTADTKGLTAKKKAVKRSAKPASGAEADESAAI